MSFLAPTFRAVLSSFVRVIKPANMLSAGVWCREFPRRFFGGRGLLCWCRDWVPRLGAAIMIVQPRAAAKLVFSNFV